MRFNPDRLLRWGQEHSSAGGGLAFRTPLEQLFLVRPTLGPPSDLVLVQPASVVGGSLATGTVTLPEPAPAAGTVASLTSSDPAATVPTSLMVGAGETSNTFPIITRRVLAPVDVVIQAAYGTVRTTHLQVLPVNQP